MKSILQSSAIDLQERLQSGDLTSVQIVGDFLDQISAHNHDGMRLNALISILDRPLALAMASILDNERAQGKTRSPLHGIPIVIKDCIVTGPDLGMPTTVGSHIFSKQKAIGNAPVVDQVPVSVHVNIKTTLSDYCKTAPRKGADYYRKREHDCKRSQLQLPYA
ncbi:hypothetical protein RRF57_001575 [Xylaria bambusicola]|uniref:Amidase domain-containing protein n=1 Tax=Xylaria bambusicola TaxID=326684 RepID=A0AAN7UH73_9PEZI